MTLQKAELKSLDGEEYDFKFMYNPTEISISKKANVTANRGARANKTSLPKVSFAYPSPTTINIKNIVLDSYENRKNRDVSVEIAKLTKTVKFINNSGNQKEFNRPPIYLFTWGTIKYIYCFVESLDYQITLFLEDGTPVRAKASIMLKEVDPPNKTLKTSPPKIDRNINTRWLTE